MKRYPRRVYAALDASGEPLDFDTNLGELKDRVNNTIATFGIVAFLTPGIVFESRKGALENVPTEYRRR